MARKSVSWNSRKVVFQGRIRRGVMKNAAFHDFEADQADKRQSDRGRNARKDRAFEIAYRGMIGGIAVLWIVAVTFMFAGS